ncbi:MAG: hypothetical protein WC263_01265 [Candidatus Micrarchaeia archaeon]|jgi:hypothetical protein
MSNCVITRSEARQLNKAFVKTEGKFDTTASRLLTERIAARVAASPPLKEEYTREDIKLAAAMVFKEGAIKEAAEKTNQLLPYALSYGLDKKYCINGTYYGKVFWDYEIVSPLKALKTSFSIGNFADTMRESRQEKMRLAREAETAINESLRVAQDSRVRIAEYKEHEKRLHSTLLGQQ